MQEVLRMLRGEQWPDIQAERKQRQEFWTAACVILLVGALAACGSSL